MTGPQTPEIETGSSPPRGPRRWWWILTATALIVAGLAVTYWTLPQRASRTQRASRFGHDTAAAVIEPVSLVNALLADRPTTLVERMAEKHDPSTDTWDTEVLSADVGAQLKHLGKLIENPESIDPEHVSPLVTEDFQCSTLGGTQLAGLKEVFNDRIMVVRRREAGVPEEETDQRGDGALLDALKQLVEGLGRGQDIRVKLKVSRIEKAEQSFTTRILFEASNRNDDSGAQQNATWICQWTFPKGENAPRMQRIDLEDYEHVEIKSKHGTLFADCTESALGQNACYQQQVLPGIDHWLTRLTRMAGMSMFGHNGLAVADVNGDGLEDLYVCDSGGLPNRLFVQNEDATLTDVSAQARVDWVEDSSAVLLVDLDNDGDQDLIVSTMPLLLFAENNGKGRFTVRQRRPAVETMCAADYDHDGDLDIYCGNYGATPGATGDQSQRSGFETQSPMPYHDANNGGSNLLLRNDGNFQFVDVTEETRLNVNNTRFSFAAAWEDYDNDGDMDIYVANDFGRNNLYRNDNGHFTDVAAQAAVEDTAAGMSVAWGDYNRDGLVDLYVGNMYSGAGNRVTFQRRFAQGRADPTVAQTQRMARGNTLFANTPEGVFHDVSETAAVNMGRWAWSSKFADLNNDGWLDLVVANGYMTNPDTGDL